MKRTFALLCTGVVSLLVGCSSTPIALAPVGPNPAGIQKMASRGELVVFSSLAEQSDDESQGSTDPSWFQHSDYSIYDLNGKLVERVNNRAGHYELAPRLVTLAAGRYLVKAEAKDYFWVEVPVTIEPGRTTRVHLDDNWKPSANALKTALVTMPNGIPVGWRVQSSKEIGIK